MPNPISSGENVYEVTRQALSSFPVGQNIPLSLSRGLMEG